MSRTETSHLEELQAVAAPLLVADLSDLDRSTVRSLLLSYFWRRKPDLQDCVRTLEAILLNHLMDRHSALMKALGTPYTPDFSFPLSPVDGTWTKPLEQAPPQNESWRQGVAFFPQAFWDLLHERSPETTQPYVFSLNPPTSSPWELL